MSLRPVRMVQVLKSMASCMVLCNAKCAALVLLPIFTAVFGDTAFSQGLSGDIASPAPVFGIPPSANTQRALRIPPGEIRGLKPGFYASLGLDAGWTDNVNRVPDDLASSDTIAALTGALGYRTNLGRHAASIDYTGFIERYREFENLNSEDHRLRGAADFDLTQRLNWGLFAGYADVNERRGSPGSPVLQVNPNRVEIVDYGTTVDFGTRAPRHMWLKVGADVEDWRYQNNDQQFRDRDTFNVFGELHYNVSAKSSVFLLSTYREFDYTNPDATASDSDEITLQGGVEWRATEKTRGRISIGELEKDFKDPAVPTENTTTYNLQILWQPRLFTKVSAYGSRRTEETTSPEGNFYISTVLGLSVVHSFADRWTGNIYYNYIDDDFDIGRQDRYDDFGVGLDYFFNRWLSLGVRYAYIKRDSNIELNKYEENVFGLVLKTTFFR